MRAAWLVALGLSAEPAQAERVAGSPAPASEPRAPASRAPASTPAPASRVPASTPASPASASTPVSRTPASRAPASTPASPASASTPASRAPAPASRAPASTPASRAPAPASAPARGPDCLPDEVLSRAAAELLLAGRFKPEATELIAAVREAGSDAVSLHALYLPSDMADGSANAAQSGWMIEQRQRTDAALRCGSAQSEHGRLWISSPSGGTLQPLAAGEPLVVRGALAPGFERAELVVSSADGQLARYGVSAEALARGVELEPEDSRELCGTSCTVQLVACGPAGPRPVAERWVRAGEAPSPLLMATATEGELGLTALIAELRAVRGRPKLRENSLLAQAAGSHAKLVCERGQVAHQVREGEGPETRLARVGLSARILGEAIARAEDAPAAFAALQRSPSHLFTLLDARFTDFAVGVASDRAGKRCYVVMLCAWPRPMAR